MLPSLCLRGKGKASPQEGILTPELDLKEPRGVCQRDNMKGTLQRKQKPTEKMLGVWQDWPGGGGGAPGESRGSLPLELLLPDLAPRFLQPRCSRRSLPSAFANNDTVLRRSRPGCSVRTQLPPDATVRQNGPAA